MKTGIAMIEVVSVSCPECQECWFGAYDGSSMITNDASEPKAGQVVECDTCGSKFRLPSILKKIGQ